jgi:hypothetical protein
MIAYERPPEPADFRAKVHDVEAAIARAIAAGESLPFDDYPLWQDYKSEFALAQKSKCAFCDRNATTDDPHVDHFAPKAEVWELPASDDERGREVHDGLPNVRGRKPSRKVNPGYWWRAYEWANYLLICGVCNTKWKRCFFPVDAEPRAWPPDRDVDERPFLLNPFDDAAPWRSFGYDALGEIWGTDARGCATIDVCGLDRRETLRAGRMDGAREAYRHVFAFARPRSRELARYALENLCELGRNERDFAGVVRAIAEVETGLAWEQLCHLLEHWPFDAGRSPASPASSDYGRRR